MAILNFEFLQLAVGNLHTGLVTVVSVFAVFLEVFQLQILQVQLLMQHLGPVLDALQLVQLIRLVCLDVDTLEHLLLLLMLEAHVLRDESLQNRHHMGSDLPFELATQHLQGVVYGILG